MTPELSITEKLACRYPGLHANAAVARAARRVWLRVGNSIVLPSENVNKYPDGAGNSSPHQCIMTQRSSRGSDW